MAFDAIFIPGGGVRKEGLPPWVAARLDRALELAGDAFLVPLSAGTPHRPPPLDERGFPITEARAGAEYLVERGADPKRVLIESASYDTIGNAYFSRVMHAIPRQFRRALVITSAFHMARTEAAFRWIYGLPGPGVPCELAFEAVPDTGIPPDILKTRTEKEATALAALEETRRALTSLVDLHLWLFTTHGAYAVTRPPGSTADPATY